MKLSNNTKINDVVKMLTKHKLTELDVSFLKKKTVIISRLSEPEKLKYVSLF